MMSFLGGARKGLGGGCGGEGGSDYFSTTFIYFKYWLFHSISFLSILIMKKKKKTGLRDYIHGR